MADRLTLAVRSTALVAAWAFAAVGAQAQGSMSGLSDPTRPPGAGMAAQGGPDDSPPGRQLQSVLFSGGRKLAVIDGRVVPLGGMVGDARVVKISETEVVLKNGTETETLKLYPGIEKQQEKRAARRARSGAASPAPSPLGGPK